MIKFVKSDLGKLVEVELDSEKNKLARALGASAVSVHGTLLEIKAGSIVVETMIHGGFTTHRRKKEIEYDLIKSYKFT
ncbi:MAG TPA: hypothetical protein VJH68_04070 [Candidatus Nanoarchaeia archaeon]|nr:hypothetical protein [Candidatus Nanoarchaeia archaeon]